MSTLRNSFLGEMNEFNEFASIFLLNGICIKGHITAFDETCVIVGDKQLIMWKAISTIQPENIKTK